MLTRIPIAFLVAALMTVAILFTMQALVTTARRELDDSGTRHFVDFVRVEREELAQRKGRKAEKPPAPEPPPPDAPLPRLDSVDRVALAMNIPTVEVGFDLSIEGLGLDVSDGEYLPIVKITPIYPWGAQSAGVEGRCIVEYTVTATGTVRDVRVIEAEPKGFFEKTSIDAALKSRYKPRVVNGTPIDVQGVRSLFTYTLNH